MSNSLRSLWGEPRPTPAPPPRVWRDWALLAAVAVSTLLEGVLTKDIPLRGLAIAYTLGLAPTLLWRRSQPLAMVSIAFGAAILLDVVLFVADAEPFTMVTMLYFLLLPYALFRWGSGREVTIGLAIILVAATWGFVVAWTGVADAFGGMAVLASSMVLGLAVRSENGARERRVEQAKSEERVQLARELHDTVAHHVSAIAIQAQAGRALAESNPAAPVEALDTIEVEATRTLAEMRAIVRMLRNQDPADYAPQAGVADLDRLGDGSSPGPRVEVTRSGDLHGLPAQVDAAVFRIAQEAVTNALRHARNATHVDVRVTGAGSSVHLVIRDDGDRVSIGPGSAPGFGVTGMVERAALLGGTCAVGPCPDRGWAVEAWLPRQVTR